MARSPSGPRKPATKFPHLRKQMQKNQLPTLPNVTGKKFLPKRPGGK
jgi:hypothetical protein